MTWVLVTGASSGIGLEFCHSVALRGHNVVLVARSQEKLEELAVTLQQYYRVETEVLPADLSDPEQIEKVAKRLRQDTKPISLLVNNAGFAPGQSFLGGEAKRERETLTVMVEAVMMLSKAAAESMSQRGRGAIINLSSIVAGLNLGTYATHKTWVERFSINIQKELKGSGVRVIAVKPGTTRTNFFNNLSISEGSLPRLYTLDPAKVAEKALHDLARGKLRSVPGIGYRIIEFLIAYSPRPLVDAVGAFLQKRYFKL